MKAKSDAERAKAYRDRKKLREAGLLVDPEPPAKLVIPRTLTLSEFVQSRGEEAVEAFEWMREELDLPVQQFLVNDHKEQEIEWTHNVITAVQEALETITGFLSEYWKDQIDREIARLKAQELIDPTIKDDALAKIVRFSAVRKSLDKRYRLTLQNYEPEG